MRLATLRDGSIDGALIVVSADHRRFLRAGPRAPTLEAALDRWDLAEPYLRELAHALDHAPVAAEPFVSAACMAPLPRGRQFLDASAFPSHGLLMQRAFDLPPIPTDPPLMYQGLSHQYLGPHDPVVFPTAEDGIDFEAEFAVFLDHVPMNVAPDAALGHVRLIGLLNDWSLRRIAPIEMKTGFGWIGAKPASSFAPILVTPDALGSAWHDGIVDLVMEVWRNADRFGAVPSHSMQPGFGALIAHAARTRTLCAGTILGSGTVSVPDCATHGSCCIAERRGLEMLEHGTPRTQFLNPGERVRILARRADGGPALFGTIDQRVVLADPQPGAFA